MPRNTCLVCQTTRCKDPVVILHRSQTIKWSASGAALAYSRQHHSSPLALPAVQWRLVLDRTSIDRLSFTALHVPIMVVLLHCILRSCTWAKFYVLPTLHWWLACTESPTDTHDMTRCSLLRNSRTASYCSRVGMCITVLQLLHCEDIIKLNCNTMFNYQSAVSLYRSAQVLYSLIYYQRRLATRHSYAHYHMTLNSKEPRPPMLQQSCW